jgi:hypothetical protein
MATWPIARSLSPTCHAEAMAYRPAILESMSEPGRILQGPGFTEFMSAHPSRTVLEDSLLDREWLLYDWPLAFGKSTLNAYNTIRLESSQQMLTGFWSSDPSTWKDRLDFFRVRYVLSADPIPGYRHPPAPGSPKYLWESPTLSPTWCIVEDSNTFRIHGQSGATAMPIGENSPNRISLEMAADGGGGLLTGSEAAAPGWKVFVDGREEAWEVTGAAFRGVRLGAGPHNIVWSYEPVSIRLGLFAAFTALFIWSLLAAGVFVRHLRKPITGA